MSFLRRRRLELEEVNEADTRLTRRPTTESSSPAKSEKGSTIATVSPSKKRLLEADLERSCQVPPRRCP
jgi:hypothetical protein